MALMFRSAILLLSRRRWRTGRAPWLVVPSLLFQTASHHSHAEFVLSSNFVEQFDREIWRVVSLCAMTKTYSHDLAAALRDLLSHPLCSDVHLLTAARHLPRNMQDAVWAAILIHDRWSEDLGMTCSLMMAFAHCSTGNRSLTAWDFLPQRDKTFPHFNTFVLCLSEHIAHFNVEPHTAFKMLNCTLTMNVPNAAALLDVVSETYADRFHCLGEDAPRLLARMCSSLWMWRLKSPAAVALLKSLLPLVLKFAWSFELQDLIYTARSLTCSGIIDLCLLEIADRRVSASGQVLPEAPFRALCSAFHRAKYKTVHFPVADECVRRSDSLPRLAECLWYLADVKPKELAKHMGQLVNSTDPRRWSVEQLSALLVSMTKKAVMDHCPNEVACLAEKIAMHVENMVDDLPFKVAPFLLRAFGSCGMTTRPWVGLLDRIAIRCCTHFDQLSNDQILWLIAGLHAAYQSNCALLHVHGALTSKPFARRDLFAYSSSCSVVGGLSVLVKRMSAGWTFDLDSAARHRYRIEQLCVQVRDLRLSAAKGLLSSLALYGYQELCAKTHITREITSIAYTLSALSFKNARAFFRLLNKHLERGRFCRSLGLTLEVLCTLNVACILQGFYSMSAMQTLVDMYADMHDDQRASIQQCSFRLLWLSHYSYARGGPVFSAQQDWAIRKTMKLSGFNVPVNVRRVLCCIFSEPRFNIPTASNLCASVVVFLDQHGNIPQQPCKSLPVDERFVLQLSGDDLYACDVRPLVIIIAGERCLAFKSQTLSHQGTPGPDLPVGSLLLLLDELTRHGFPVVVCSREELMRLPSLQAQYKYLRARIPSCFRPFRGEERYTACQKHTPGSWYDTRIKHGRHYTAPCPPPLICT